MKISLIYPLLSKDRSSVDENKQFWPPLGLAYIAAMLTKNNHEVQIIDRDLIFRKQQLDFKKTDEVTLQQILAFDSDVVGFSATTPNMSDVKFLSSIIKKSRPKMQIVLGGPHATGEPVLTLESCPDVDIVVRGEGEETMIEIVEGKALSQVLGITYRTKEHKTVSNEDRPLIADINLIPMPARALLDMDFYTRPSRFTSRNLSLRTTDIFTARGCPYRCHYCAGPLMGRNKLRFHSPERVLAEVQELISTYHVEAIYFAEDMFLSNENRAKELLNLFIDNGINKKIIWMAQLSTKIVSMELLSLMKKAGCVHIEYGFESGSQRVLDLMNKRVTVEQNAKAARLTRKLGIRFQGNFIVGYPGETESDFKDTIAFIKRVKPSHTSVNMFMPLPGTHIYNKLKEEKRLFPGWDDIGNQDAPQLNYADMPPSRFEELYLKARLTVILPLNMWHFFVSNFSHPVRFIYIVFSQSSGLLIKVLRATKKLIKLRSNRLRIKLSEQFKEG